MFAKSTTCICRTKPSARPRATVARERGLEPLATLLAAQVDLDATRASILEPFVDPTRGVENEESALRGASDLIAERWSEDPATRSWLRFQLGRGFVTAKKKRGYDGDDHRFEDFYDYREPIARLASHRVLAMRRGESENALSIAIDVDDDQLTDNFARHLLTNPLFLFRPELEATVRDCYARLLKPSISTEVLSSLRDIAESHAINVFATNLGELLLAPPAHKKAILGIDPGFRTGCKVAVIDSTGRLVAHATVYPTAPSNDTETAERELTRLIDAHDVELIAIGNGTASRETAAFCARLEKAKPHVTKVIVNESGASIYSASAMAREEFPDLDLTVRGAISIARRLQDPLAELVKIDPKSIGVGQYQHDVSQAQLKKALDRVVSSSVNRVGVDVNTASAVHPESYYIVEKIAEHLGCRPRDLLGDDHILHGVDPESFVDGKTGLPTIRDILAELSRPGRDPRREFEPLRFADGVESIDDVATGMRLEGMVTNVTHFGAFVDIGVHQDGLVHVSELDNRFVKDPTEIVKVGDRLRVEVLEVDRRRRRIALSRKRALD